MDNLFTFSITLRADRVCVSMRMCKQQLTMDRISQ